MSISLSKLRLSKLRALGRTAFGVSLLISVLNAPAMAGNWLVANLNDSGSGSFRDAATSALSGDTITFAPGLSGTMYLASGQITIANSVTVVGPVGNGIVISGANSPVSISAGATVSVSNLTFSNGAASNYGGVVSNSGTLTLTKCIFTNNAVDANHTSWVGTVSNQNNLTVANCSFTGNTVSVANYGGGAISSNGILTVKSTVFNGNASSEGAISASGTLTVENCGFSKNNPGAVYVDSGFATIQGSAFDTNISSGSGGALRINQATNVAVTNSTFTGNQAQVGGAIYNGGGVLRITSSTIVQNSTSGSYTFSNGGGIDAYSGTTTVTSSIVAGNISTNSPSNYPIGSDIDFASGTLTSGGSNLIGDGSTTNFVNGTNHDIIGTTAAPINPMVGALASNGGPTYTIALLKGSLAIDADYAGTGSVIADQRGIHRPQGVRNDIGAFEYVAGILPVVTAFSPASGAVGTFVTINGSGFSSASSVTFNGVASTAFIVASDSIIVATVPSGATTGPIGVKSSAGTGSSSGSFTVTTTATKISSFTPASGPVGTSVSITGSGFTGASAVKFGTAAATVVSVASDTLITATVPTGALTGKITVTAPAGTATSATNYTVTASPPTVTSFSPASGPVGTKITVTGTNLTGATAVKVNGFTCTSVAVTNSTTLSATVPAGATTGNISVTTPAGLAYSSTAFVVALPVPTVTSFSPASGPVGTKITVTGTNLTGSVVKVDGFTCTSVVVASPTSLTAIIPTGATTGNISVTTTTGTAYSPTAFVVTLPLPTVTTFGPTSGFAGKAITIKGTNLAGATLVNFNGVASTSISSVTSTSLIATVPVGATTGTISVTTPGGTGSSTSAFTITAPVLSAFTISPATIAPGASAVATVTLTSAAPSGGLIVSIKQGTGSPFSLTIPAGQTSASFPVNILPGTPAGKYVFTATYGGVSKTATVTVS